MYQMYQILLGQFNETCIAHLLSRGSRNIRQVNPIIFYLDMNLRVGNRKQTK